MSREVFPFDADRTVIRAFLAGSFAEESESGVSLLDGKLYVGNASVAWFDSAGALTVTAQMAGGISTERLIAFMCDELGIPERKLRREVIPIAPEPAQVGERVQYYCDDKLIRPGEPFVLAGPLTVQAYRAANGGKIR